MSRIFYTFLIAALLVVPYMAHADESALPTVIQHALHDAAATGNALVVDATADRMSNLFPSYRGEINAYVDQVVTPAAVVMANVDIMLASIPGHGEEGFALFDSHEMTEESEAASLAEDLNNLDIGAEGEPILQ